MVGWSPGCYIPSFVEIGPPDPKRFMKCFYHIWGGVHLGHQILISLYLKACKQNLVQIGTVVSEKIQFEFLYVHDLGLRSRNDLDLQYSHIFIYSNKCLLLLTFRSLVAIVSEKFIFFTFFIEKPK